MEGLTLVYRKASKLVPLYLAKVITNKITKKKVLVGKANTIMTTTQVSMMIKVQDSVQRTTSQEARKDIIKWQASLSPNNKLAQVLQL